jgi:type III secretory pathway component EscR
MKGEMLNPLWLIVFGFIFSLLPLVLSLATSFAKVSIVVGMLKNALGVPHVPGLLVEGALSITLSLTIMSPVIDEMISIAPALPALSTKNIPTAESLSVYGPLLNPWVKFLEAHTKQAELAAVKDFVPQSTKTLPILFTAFLLSELKSAFIMAYALLLPFLAIDIIVGNILAGLGMFMMSPITIALPLKLFLFVQCNGWVLLAKSLVSSYRN